MNNAFTVILFYRFVHVDSPQMVAEAHREKCKELGLKGRIILAPEGINATLEGSSEGIENYKLFLEQDSRFRGITIKESQGNGTAFPKLRIMVRDEVVTLGAGNFDVQNETARELKTTELNKWYAEGEDFVILDLRNDYEIATGKFDRTVDPGLTNFRDLPEKLESIAHLKNKKVVAVCTGGIRCEKATCLLKREGFSDIYQLKDGIHTYMKESPGKHFKGSLFVFDNRMVTDVVQTGNKEVIGKCLYCTGLTENYCSDDRVRPSKKILCCPRCYEVNKDALRDSKRNEIR